MGRTKVLKRGLTAIQVADGVVWSKLLRGESAPIRRECSDGVHAAVSPGGNVVILCRAELERSGTVLTPLRVATEGDDALAPVAPAQELVDQLERAKEARRAALTRAEKAEARVDELEGQLSELGGVQGGGQKITLEIERAGADAVTITARVREGE